MLDDDISTRSTGLPPVALPGGLNGHDAVVRALVEHAGGREVAMIDEWWMLRVLSARALTPDVHAVHAQLLENERHVVEGSNTGNGR